MFVFENSDFSPTNKYSVSERFREAVRAMTPDEFDIAFATSLRLNFKPGSGPQQKFIAFLHLYRNGLSNPIFKKEAAERLQGEQAAAKEFFDECYAANKKHWVEYKQTHGDERALIFASDNEFCPVQYKASIILGGVRILGCLRLGSYNNKSRSRRNLYFDSAEDGWSLQLNDKPLPSIFLKPGARAKAIIKVLDRFDAKRIR